MFKFKQKITSQASDPKDVEIMIPLKYLSDFWRTLEIRLMNCKINLMLTWSANCIISTVVSQATAFAITDAKLYVLVVTFSTQDNAKL